jgi:hypothetical protein
MGPREFEIIIGTSLSMNTRSSKCRSSVQNISTSCHSVTLGVSAEVKVAVAQQSNRDQIRAIEVRTGEEKS